MTAKKAAPVVPAAGSIGPLRSAKASLLQRFAAPVLVACIGIATGLGLFAMVRNWELSRSTREFEGRAQERITAVESHMYSHVRSLDTLRALFLASEKVERWEFTTFADVVMAPESEIRLLGWIARVPESQREAYEQARRNEGFEDFGIHPWSQSDQDVVAREGEWLFPVHFVEPQADGRAMLGLDLFSNPTCQAAMERARDTGDAAATAPLLLGGEMANQQSVVIFLPIYEKDAPTVSTEERRESLAGFVFGTYLANDILAHAIKPLAPGEINLLVLDISTSPDGQFLGVHWSRSIEPPAQAELPILAHWRESTLRKVAAFNVAGRSWQVLCKPTEAFIATRTTWVPWLGLLSAWGLTGLLVAYLQTIRTGRSRTEVLAMELADANESLLTEIEERESANEDLWASEQQFKALVANVPGVTYRCACDEHWTMEFISNEVEAISGYPASDFIGNAVRSYASIIHPDDAHMVEDVVLEAIRNKEPYTMGYRILRADGSIRWVYDRGRGNYDDEGVLKWLDGVAVDVTEHKWAEEALRQSEQRHRTLFESSRDAIMTLAPPSWKFTAGNAAAVEMFGAKDEAEFSSLGPWELSPEFQPDGKSSADKAMEMIETAMRNGSHFFEWTHKRVNGEEFPATVLLTRVELGGQMLLQATVRNITERRQAEQALRESETRYRALFEGSAEGIIVADVETRSFRYANAAICEMLGYTEQELVQMGVRDVHPPKDLDRVISSLQAQARGESALAPEVPCLRQDGSIFYADINATEIVIDGQSCLVGFFADVTERRQAEQALRESEQRYRAILESAAEGILIADIDTKKFLFANPAVSAMLGYSEGELLNMGIQDIHLPEDMPRNIARFEAAATGKTKVILDIPCVRKDGTIVFADINTGTMLLDGRECLIGLFTDVTERRRADQALRESEARYRQLVEGLSEGIAALDENGIITFVNKAFTQIVGESVADLIGGDFFGSTNEFQREAFRRSFLEQRHGPGHVYQTNFVRRDGQLRHMSMQGSPIIDDDGNHIGVLAVINDITQRRQAEESLKAAHRKLMYAGEQERHALATDLHDSLGQQAVAIHLAIEGLLTDARRTGDSSADSLARLSHLCQSLTEDIRTTCHGLFPPTLEALGLCATLRQLVRDYENIIDVTADCAAFPEDARLEPDIEIALFRIAQEAITNVLRHGKAEHLTLGMILENGQVTLTVANDGIDFNVEEAEATGLGLSTMRERANAVGGTLEIDSRPGRTSIVARVSVTGRDDMF